MTHRPQLLSLVLLAIVGCARPELATTDAASASADARLSEYQVLEIAELELANRYPATFKNGRPFRAKFGNGLWHVYGTLPEGWVGGTPEVYVRDADRAVVRIMHGR